MKYIVTGDQHLRLDVPICRVETQEEWVLFQSERLKEIVNYANNNMADIVFTGDTFDSSRVPYRMVSILIDALHGLYGIAHFISGNHEKAYHREANVDSSSIGIIKAIAGDNTSTIRYYTPDEHIDNTRFEHSYKLNEEITIVHTLCFPDEESIPFAVEGITPKYLLDKYDTPFIFVGDYHGAYHHKSDNRHVISSGCMTAQTVKEASYTPTVYLVDTGIRTDVSVLADKHPVHRQDNVKIRPLSLYHDASLVSNEHIMERKVRDDRISSAIETIKGGGTVSLSFMDNLRVALSVEDILEATKNVIEEIGNEAEI